MENLESEEAMDAPKMPTTVPNENDADIEEEENETTMMQQSASDSIEEDEFGDFDVAVAPEEFGETGKDDEERPVRNDGGSDEPTVATKDEFGAFAAPTETVNSEKEGIMDQNGTQSDEYDDPFGHLSTDEAPEAEDVVGVNEPSPVESHAAVDELNAAVSNGEDSSSSPDEDIGYFSTHLKESESGIESSENGQDSLPDNDAGYFSAFDANGGDETEGGDHDEQGDDMGHPMVSTDGKEANETDAALETVTTDVPVNPSLEQTESDKLSTSDKSVEHDDVFSKKEGLIDEDGSESGSSALDATAPAQQNNSVEASPKQIQETEESTDEVSTKESAVVETDNSRNDDDEFGDFGSFEQASETVASTAGTVEPQFTEERSLDKVETESDAIADEDDFGDFGSFEQAPATATPAPSDTGTGGFRPPEGEPVQTGGDDFGEFGSFEDTTVTRVEQSSEAPSQPEDDDFGDFTDFAEGKVTSHSSVAETKPQAPITVADPTITRAEAVFSDVFGRGNVTGEDSENDSERTVVEVNSALAEIGSLTIEETPSEWLVDALASVMRGVAHLDKSGPVAVANEYSEHPYGHFTVPICGLPLTKVDIQGRSSYQPRPSRRTAEMSAFCEVERIVGPSFSAESVDSAPPPPAQPTIAPQATGTVVSLPPLKSDSSAQNGSDNADTDFADFRSASDQAESLDVPPTSVTESNGNKETLSLSTKQFLQQIPDLGFMLKSTLSLPKK